MRAANHIKYLLFSLGILMLMGINHSFAQELTVKSSKVGFQLNNLEESAPVIIKIVTPPIGNATIYTTDKSEVHLIGKLEEKLAIKFVSINTEMIEVSENGYFTSNLKLVRGENQIKFTTIDANNQINEQILTIQFEPVEVTLEERISKESNYYGLIIGIDDYVDVSIQDLDFPIEDAEKVYYTLTENFTFNHFNTTLLKNPTRDEIINALDALSNKVKPTDNVLIFYAGHGDYDQKAEIGYWLASDAKSDGKASWLSNSRIVDYMKSIDSKHTLLVTDACFAGTIFKTRSFNKEKENAVERIYDLRSRKAMTSGAQTEVSDKSEFIKYLLLRLNENEESYLFARDLFGDIYMAVSSNSNAIPQYGDIQNVGNEGGDFIFLKRE